MPDYKENTFLPELLTLQQDGSGAISAPSNWTVPPLLEVTTDLDRTVDSIAPKLLSSGGTNPTGTWWFLVGSPGNGKSAAVGRLVRNMYNKGNASFRLEKSSSGELGQDIAELPQTEIPYQVELYEDGATYSSAWFAQDASVVRNPYAIDADPAKELENLVKQANKKGVSLVVCANRGVLERACEVAGRQHENKSKAWYRALQAASTGKSETRITLETEGRKPVFKSVDVVVTPLDAVSLLLADTFKKLLGQATAESRWASCVDCAASEVCPFKQNRDWLAQSQGADRLTLTLRMAELYSGQIIVFREAVALISLMLSGCPLDYENQSPCSWVRERVEAGATFSLLARRIYMILFSSFSPFGLEADDDDQQLQLNAISELAQPPRVPDATSETIQCLTNPEHHVSPDVGIVRLLGKDGVLAQLDPIREGQRKDLEQQWDASPDQLLNTNHSLISKLERECFSLWRDLENGLEGYGEHTVDAYKSLRRWVTSITYRLGFFCEGKLLFEKELTKLDRTIENAGVDVSPQRDLHLAEISDQLKNMLSISDHGIKIGPFVNVTGNWVTREMEVHVTGNASSSGGLEATVGGKPLDLSALVYAWLDRKATSGLSKETFPDDVLQVAEDIRRRAATSSSYAFSEGDVRLHIDLPGRREEKIELRRIRNRAIPSTTSD